MGLLFVTEGDSQAIGSSVDIGMNDHAELINIARDKQNGKFPLVRRCNHFYTDVLYEGDELPDLIEELKALQSIIENTQITKIINLCEEAISKNLGIETIAD